MAAFAAVEGWLPASLGPLPRLIGWGCVMAIVSMGLYRLVSPQRKIATLRMEAAAARQQLATFDGEFEQLMPMVRRSLLLSMRQIGWIFFPALLASLPLVASLLWLDSAYSFQAPFAGQQIALTALPEGAIVRAEPEAGLGQGPTGLLLTWPHDAESVMLFDEHGTSIAALVAGRPGANIIEPRLWWNSIIGNPMGYLPEGSPVTRLQFAFQELQVIGAEPAWYTGWEAAFFATLIALSLLIKVVFRIE